MFKKGQSGNPNGRPKDALGMFLREKKNLPQDIFNAVYPLLQSNKEQTRIWAAEFLRDSAWGKPAQAMQLTDSDGQPLVLRLVNFGDLVKENNGNGNGNHAAV